MFYFGSFQDINAISASQFFCFIALIISDNMYNIQRGFTTLDHFFPPRVWPQDPCRMSKCTQVVSSVFLLPFFIIYLFIFFYTSPFSPCCDLSAVVMKARPRKKDLEEKRHGQVISPQKGLLINKNAKSFRLAKR